SPVVADAPVAEALAQTADAVPAADSAQHLVPGTWHPPDEGDRRLVTVLFADVTGSTVMGERLDPEEITEIMNRGFDRLVAAVHPYGGTIGRFMGDGMLALFGAPEAHEDDPERAIRAALRMQASVVEYRDRVRRKWGVEYQIRVGINTGMVVASRVGGGGVRDYTVMGDTVNTAARLESAAPIGGVLVGPETYALTRPLFEFSEVEYKTLKGKAEPFPTYRVLGELAQPTFRRRTGGGEAPLLGRDRELAELLGWLEAEGPGVAAVVGEAGSGKSRLIAEARRADDARRSTRRWATARCFSYTQQSDYAALATLLPDLLTYHHR